MRFIDLGDAALLMPDGPEALEGFVLANAPKFVKARQAADADLASGKTTSLDNYLARQSSRGRSSKANKRREGEC